jgi:hypothetical protein
MTVRISELNELSVDLSQSDVLPIVDISAGETKQIQTSSLLQIGISGAPSSFIDLSKLDQNSVTKLGAIALESTGVASGVYGAADTVGQFTVNDQGLVTTATGITIVISADNVTGLAPVATSGDYQSLTGLPTLGTLSPQDADNVTISGGTISGITLVTGDATISGGTITGIVDLAVADGGTGASTAEDARSNLGLAIGSNVQAYSNVLSDIAAQFDEPDEIVYASASGVVAGTPFTAFARSIVSGSTASGVRDTLELGSIALQDANSVDITGGTISGATFISGDVTISGGTISGITDLAIDDGGTGASTASGARTNLGLAIGSDVQAYNVAIDGTIAAFSTADSLAYSSASGVVEGAAITSFGRTFVAQSGATEARTELGLGSIALQDAGSVAISGGTISDITDLAIADGGTGASSAADARTNLGLAIGSDIQAYDAGLASIAGLTTAADKLIYLTGIDTYAVSPLPSYSRDFLASGNSAADARNVLGLGDLSTKNLVGPGDVDAAAISGANIVSASLTFANYGDGSVLEATIGDGAVTTSKIADSGVTAIKLADDSSTIVDSGPPASNGTFVGQHYFDELSKYDYIWDGVDWQRQAALEEIDFTGSAPIAFTVTYPDLYSASIATELTEQNAATVLAGPTTGSAAVPTFRNTTSH